MNRILGFFNREISGVHQAAYLLGFFAICSQILALFRDRILASRFGAGDILDLYYSAFRIPDLLFVTVASIVSISVLIPFLLEHSQKSQEEAKKFIDSVFTFFFCFMLVSGLLAYFLAPTILKILFPPFVNTDSFPKLLALTRILILSPVFLGLSNLLASITQIHKRFFLYALSPVFYNVGIIVGIVFLYPQFGLNGLGFGVVIGALLHAGIQIPFVISKGMFPKLRFPFEWSVVKKIITTSIPRTITVSSNELTELFLISYASFLIPGSISIFNFSFNLQSVPFSIIGVSYSLAAFPLLTKLFSSGSKQEFVDQMATSTRHIIFWSVPISVMFVVLRAQIVRTILGVGNFNWDDTRLTAAALALFTVSLLAQNLVTLFVRAYYSRGKTKTPLVMNVLSSLFIVVLSYMLVYVFQHNFLFREFIESLFKVSGIPGTIVLMLPLGFSVGVLLNLVVHWIGFNMDFPTYSKTVMKTLYQVLSASVVMGYVSYISLGVFDMFFHSLIDISTTLGIFLQGFVAGITGLIVFVILLMLLKNKEIVEVWSALHRKIWKAKVVAPDATV